MAIERPKVELQTGYLDHLIGGPVLALIQAEWHVAEATAEFVKLFGFEQEQKSATETDSGHIGNLRMISFRYNKMAENGKMRTYLVSVPLLSLVPIPALQIKEAEFDFDAKIISIGVESEASDDDDKEAEGGDFFSSFERPMLKASIARTEGAATQRTPERRMKVKLKVQQADLPTGLAHMLRVLDQGVISTPDSASENEKKEVA